MQVINIAPRDIYFTIDFSLNQLTYLKKILDHSTIEYDGEQEPEMAEAVEYMNKILMPELIRLVKEE